MDFLTNYECRVLNSELLKLSTLVESAYFTIPNNPVTGPFSLLLLANSYPNNYREGIRNSELPVRFADYLS
jgi:hypothetical protein